MEEKVRRLRCCGGKKNESESRKYCYVHVTGGWGWWGGLPARCACEASAAAGPRAEQAAAYLFPLEACRLHKARFRSASSRVRRRPSSMSKIRRSAHPLVATAAAPGNLVAARCSRRAFFFVANSPARIRVTVTRYRRHNNSVGLV